MSELRLEFQPTSGITLAGTALLSLAAIAMLLTAIYAARLADETAAAEAAANVSADGTAAYGAGRTAHRNETELRQEISSANKVLRQLSVPWEAMFQAVEFSDGSAVTLLAMEPDIAKREVKINGETRNYPALMDYVTRLQEQPVFGSVNLRSHHVQLSDSQRPVRFSLYATWRELP